MTRFSKAIGQAIEIIIWTGRIGYAQKDRYTRDNQQDRHGGFVKGNKEDMSKQDQGDIQDYFNV
jgi:hypothetical protein